MPLGTDEDTVLLVAIILFLCVAPFVYLACVRGFWFGRRLGQRIDTWIKDLRNR